MSGTHGEEILAMLEKAGFTHLSAEEQTRYADSLIVAGFNILVKLHGADAAQGFMQAIIDNPGLMNIHPKH